MKHIVMIGPSPESRGGIASVIRSYKDAGLFVRWPIRYLSTHVEGNRLLKLFAAVRAISSFAFMIATRQVAVLHVHVARRTSFWRKTVFILFALATRCPVIVHLHSGGFWDFYWKECGCGRQGLVRFLLDHATHIVVLTHEWVNQLMPITKNRNIRHIPNYFSSTAIPALPHTTTPVDPNVLFFGRFTQEKGFPELLDAMQLVSRVVPKCRLICAGTGDSTEAHRQITNRNLESIVDLHSWVEGSDKYRLLKQATLFVLPSHYEGIPMGIIEAMAFGIPVIATHVGGIPDMITHGKEGLLVQPGDGTGLGQAIVALLNNPRLRATMSVACQRKFQHAFSDQAVLPQLELLFDVAGVQSIAA
jgi:glycosyltransferase involved in cell wall biosynthesis